MPEHAFLINRESLREEAKRIIADQREGAEVLGIVTEDVREIDNQTERFRAWYEEFCLNVLGVDMDEVREEAMLNAVGTVKAYAKEVPELTSVSATQVRAFLDLAASMFTTGLEYGVRMERRRADAA